MSLEELIDAYAAKLRKALDHLEYSHQKVVKLSTSTEHLDDEALETWESYTARFARVVDLFTTKYVRARVEREDPAFEGSLRDVLNFGEKLSLLEHAEQWLEFRKLRNATAHDYEDDDLEEFLKTVREAGSIVLALKNTI